MEVIIANIDARYTLFEYFFKSFKMHLTNHIDLLDDNIYLYLDSERKITIRIIQNGYEENDYHISEDLKLKIKELHIHELRKFAKKCGVKSPTSQNKKSLIDKLSKLHVTDVPTYNQEQKVIETQDWHLFKHYFTNIFSPISEDTLVYINLKNIKDFVIYFENLLSHIDEKFVMLNFNQYQITLQGEILKINLCIT